MIHIYYKTHDQTGNKVNGHMSRSYSLAEEFARRDIKYKLVPGIPGETSNNINIIDGVTNYFGALGPKHRYIVFHDGAWIETPDTIEILVNTSSTPAFSGKIKKLCCGLKYSILSDLCTQIARKKIQRDNTLVSIIPGGARDVFWQRLDKELFSFLTNSNNYHVVILEDVKPKEFLTTLASSRFVICPPSVVSHEAAAFGVPMFFIKTYKDQQPNMNVFLESGGAMNLNVHQASLCKMIMSNNSLLYSMRQNLKHVMPLNGKENLVDKIEKLL